MKKLFTIIAVAIMMFIGSTNTVSAQTKSDKLAEALTNLANAIASVAQTGGSCGSYNSNTGMTHFVGENCTCESSNPRCHVTRVEKLVDKTVVHLLYIPREDGPAYLTSNTEIIDNNGHLKFPLRANSGLYTDHSINLPAGQPYEFTLIFPSVTLQCQSFDIVEHYKNGDTVFHVNGLRTTYDN